MFEYQPRRHPLQTFQFWFMIGICAASVAAWRFGFFSSGSHTSLVDSPSSTDVDNEPMPPPPAGADTALGTMEPLVGPGTKAPFQTEPPSDDTQDLQANDPTRNVSGDGTAHRDSQNLASTGSTVSLMAGTEQEDGGFVQTASIERRKTDLTTQPEGEESASVIDLASIDALIDAGDDLTAHRKLSTWYWQMPDQRHQLRDRLMLLSRRIYFNPLPHYVDPHTVEFGDRLETIAKKNHVTWEYLSKINRVDPQKIRPGQKLKVIPGPFNVVVDLSDFELTVHAHGYFVTRMPIGVGKDNSTPIGTFKVTDKVVDPVYYGPDGVIKNDDPTNPIGERWIAISDEAGTVQGYGIHGTIDPQSIGKAESEGCVRLHDQDVADLYDLLTIGSEVIIRR